MATDSTDLIRTTRDAGVAFHQIHRPEKKNALNQAMYTGLIRALTEAEADDSVRVHVLQGVDGAFTTGNDIADFMGNPPTHPESPTVGFIMLLPRLEKPLIAAVDGLAVGVGTTLLLHCDLVIASDRSTFSLPFVNLGLVPEAGSSYLLPLVAGMARASELLLFGEAFTAQKAHESGIVNQVVPAAALPATVNARAKALAQRPLTALKESKRLLRAPFRATVEEVMKRELVVFGERLASPEAQEAFLAFMNKGKK